MPEKEAVPERVEVFGDESLHRGGFAVLGSLWATSMALQNNQPAIGDILQIHGSNGTVGELKWTKCSGRRLHPVYHDVVNHIMCSLRTGRLEFHALIIEHGVLRHPQWHGGDPELGIYRAWRHLLTDPLVPGAPHFVQLDYRTTRRRNLSCLLTELQPPIPSLPPSLRLTQTAFLDSNAERMLQIVDVIAGAIGYHASGAHAGPSASSGKIALAKAICYHLGCDDLAAPRAHRPFRVTRITRHRPDSGPPPPAAVLPITIERSPTRREVRLITSHESAGVAA